MRGYESDFDPSNEAERRRLIDRIRALGRQALGVTTRQEWEGEDVESYELPVGRRKYAWTERLLGRKPQDTKVLPLDLEPETTLFANQRVGITPEGELVSIHTITAEEISLNRLKQPYNEAELLLFSRYPTRMLTALRQNLEEFVRKRKDATPSDTQVVD